MSICLYHVVISAHGHIDPSPLMFNVSPSNSAECEIEYDLCHFQLMATWAAFSASKGE